MSPFIEFLICASASAAVTAFIALVIWAVNRFDR